MIISSFFSLVGVLAFHTITELGKVRYCLIASVIIAAGNALIVSFICISPAALTVERIRFRLTVVFGLSTAYLIYKFFTLPALSADFARLADEWGAER
jgi:hypothetical protein